VTNYSKEKPQKLKYETLMKSLKKSAVHMQAGAHDPCTHLANAHRIRKTWGDQLLYVIGKGWHTRLPDRPWREDETGAMRMIQPLGKQIAAEAALLASGSLEERNQSQQLLKWATKSEQLPTLRASLEMVRPLLSAQASEMDADPNMIGLPSSVLNLKTGKFRPYTAQDRITLTLAVDFSPDDKAPTWVAFIDEVMSGDGEMIDYLQQLFGYALSGYRGDHLLPVFYGDGANGKSTATGALTAAFGGYAGQAMPDLLMVRRNGAHFSSIAHLHGRRLVFAAESGEGHSLSEERVKAITGGDPITAKRLYQEPFTFNPSHLLVLSTNHQPIVKGTDYGIWRRLRLIPWDVRIPEDRQDRSLPERLLRELPGILAWCYAGWQRYQKRGFYTPVRVAQATSSYRAESDLIGHFLSECCDLTASGRIPSGELYQSYSSWCKANNEQPLQQRSLTKTLQQRGIIPCKGTGGRRELQGIALIGD